MDVITKDPQILGGTPVFRGTRVPVQTLFDYLEGGESLEDFLAGFPTVSRQAALAALEEAKQLLLARPTNAGKQDPQQRSPKDELSLESKSFFAAPTLAQLAEAQHVKPLDSPSDLAGGWPVDENIDEFIVATYQSRT